MSITDKEIHIIGGGTFYYVRNHLALAAPAFGTTARSLASQCSLAGSKMSVHLHLTKMADPDSTLVTNQDISGLIDNLVSNPAVKIIFFNPALCDFQGEVGNTQSGKYEDRLDSSLYNQTIELYPTEKIIKKIRQNRKDIFLVGFKTTCGKTSAEQYIAGLNLLKSSSCNLVLANDSRTRNNMIIVPEEGVYSETYDRYAALSELVTMTLLRSHLTFTRSTVIAGDPIPWDSPLVPDNLRTVVDFCIERGAYKRFRGVTAGHFAVKLGPTSFLTSRRKTDFNDMKNVGLVKVETDGPDNVLAYGSKPSVGGQSQRIVFEQFPGADCIVHFHCPIRDGSQVPRVSQKEFECGSHECGQNTARGLKKFDNLYAVYLDQHGPNIVFSKHIKASEVINFIQDNFVLHTKTGGYNVSN